MWRSDNFGNIEDFPIRQGHNTNNPDRSVIVCAMDFMPVELRSVIDRNPVVVSIDTTAIAAIAQMRGLHTPIPLIGMAADSNQDPHSAVDRAGKIQLAARLLSQRCAARLQRGGPKYSGGATEEKLAGSSELRQTTPRASCAIVVVVGQVVGILTERDAVRLNDNLHNRSADFEQYEVMVGRIMSQPVITLREADLTDVSIAINLLDRHQIDHLPIVDDQDRLVGLVKRQSLIQVPRSIDLVPLASPEHRLAAQNALLTKIATSAPFADILDRAISFAEQCLSGSYCSILLLDLDRQLRIGAAPNLPLSYLQELDGLKIGTGKGSCAMAAVSGKLTIVTDIATDPCWQHNRELALSHGFRSCWASPIMSSDDRVLGSFAGYYATERSPQADELETIAWIVNILGIAIDRKQSEAALRSSDARWQFALEGAGDGIWDWDIRTNTVFFSPQWKAMLGYTAAEVGHTPEEWSSRIHPDDRDYCADILCAHLEGHTPTYQTEHRVRCKDGSYKWILDRSKIVERTATGEPLRVIGTHSDITARKQAETALQNLIEGTAATIGEDFFSALASHISTALNVAYVIITKQLDASSLHSLAFCADGQLQPTLVYDLANTPCERVLQSGMFYCQANLQHQFPEEPNLGRIGAQSYLGIALVDCQGQAIGSLSIFDRQPLQDPHRAEQILRVFAARAAAELEREQATQTLALLNRELESKVTERTAALQASEQRWQLALKGANDGIWDWDLQQHRQFFSSRWKAIRGFADDEIGDSPDECFSRIHPDDYERFMAAMNQHLAGETEFFTIEYRVQCKDGNYIWVLDRGQAVRDECGQAIRSIGSNTDITAHKQIEADLAQSEAKFRHLVEGVKDVIWSCDANHRFTYLSPQFQTLFGWEPNEWIGALAFDIIHPDDRFQLASTNLRQDRSGQRLTNVEFRCRHQDGHYLWVRASHTLAVDPQGKILTHQGVVSDISERKCAEAEINRQLVAIETAIDGIGIIFDHKYIYLNQSHVDLFGYEHPEQLMGQSWRLLYAPAELDRFDRDIMPALNRDRAWRGEATATRKDGSTFGQELSLTLTDEGLIICGCRDISAQQAALQARQQAELQLQQTNAALIVANRLKDEFLATMSHELRTPLNAILGMTEGLQDGVFGSINSRQLKSLQTIERSGTHLLALINDILDVAKIESGHFELHAEDTNVSRLCEFSLAAIEPQARAKQIQIFTKLPLGLPDVCVDERRIRQVFINLLDNAIKFTPEGGQVTLEIDDRQQAADIDRQQDYLTITIIDTGIGIAPADINRLFQPFVQIDSAANRQYEGTGLGLALVKRIVELHGGRVGLTSELGVGSCFTIELPCATATSLSQDPHSEQMSISGDLNPPESSGIPLILLVEDNDANILTISSYLKAKGYRLVVAKNGREGIVLAQSERPDLILMDIHMPELDGLAAIQAIRRNPDSIDLPIIAFTALATIEDRDLCLAAGADDYISKPIQLKLLASRIHQLLTTPANENRSSRIST